MLSAAAAAAFVSCNKEEDVINEEVNGEGIALTISTGEATKTAYDGTNIGWLYEDVIGVANSSDKKEFTQTGASYEGMKSTTQFSGTVPSVGTYYAYYPYNESMLSASGVTVKLPSEQVQRYVDSSFDSFSPDADILVSQPIDVTSTSTTVSTKFKRLGAFLKITFDTSGLPSSLKTALDAQSIYGLTVTSDTDLAGSVAIDLANGELAGLSNGEKTIKLGYQASSVVPSSVSYVGIYPQTIPAGTELTITADTPKYSISRTITLTSALTIGSGKILPVTVKLEDADVEHKIQVTREWGKYPVAANTAWTSEFTSTGSFIQGNDRAAAMDEDNVYVVAASATTKGILAINKDNPSILTEVNVDGVEGGFFATACVRTIWNPSTNKYMLLVGTLCYDTGNHFKVYAYKNGISNAPECVLDFTDSQSRRLGDMFTVVGDWNNGELWVRNQDSPSTLFWKIENGVFGSALGGSIGYGGSKGRGAIYKYNVEANQVFLSNVDLGAFYNYTATTYITSFSGVNWTGIANEARLRRYGVTPFEFAGKKYIAYTYIGKKASDTEKNGARGRLKIIEDQGSASTFLASIEADRVVYECPIQNDNDSASTVEEFDFVPFAAEGPSTVKNTLADCSVVTVGENVYIAAHIENVGLSLFKMSLK